MYYLHCVQYAGNGVVDFREFLTMMKGTDREVENRASFLVSHICTCDSLSLQPVMQFAFLCKQPSSLSHFHRKCHQNLKMILIGRRVPHQS